MITITTAVKSDAAAIRETARLIWYDTYVKILTTEQVAYMLDLFYSIPKLQSQIESGEQTYQLLWDEEELVGFAAYSPRDTNPEVYKLHKLYCLTNRQKAGMGKQLLAAVEEAVKKAGKHTLELNVNRYNPAIGFYEKMGFTAAYVEDIDIGNGYWMNDYVMRKLL